MSERKVKHEKTDEKCDYICDQLVEGRSLRSICSEDNMPSVGTFLRWVANDEKLMEQYARAREIQMDTFEADMTQISDDCPPIAEEIQKAKLRIDTRKWIASKIKPKKYGDKIQTENVNTNYNVELKNPKDVDEAAKYYMDMINGGEE